MKYNHIKFFIFFFFITFFNLKILFSETTEDKIFEVKNISVEAESTSSTKAKEIALLQAQEKGFKNLMNKMLLKSEYEKIEDTSIDKILEFVDAIKIQNEKTPSTKYIGKLTIIFNEEKILSYLNSNNIKFTSLRSKPLLILPIYKFAGVTYLWEKKNIWRNIWVDDSSNEGLIPIKSSEGKFTDFILFNQDQAVKKNIKNLELLAESHNTTGVLIAILKKKFNRDKSRIFFNLNLSIYRFDGGETNTFQDTIEIYSNEYSDDVLKEAKLKVEQFVNQQWKTANVITSKKEFERITVSYKNLDDWINIKKIINNISIIDKYNVSKFSSDKAVILLSYSGNLNQLKVAFKQSDLDFDLNSKNLNLVK
ncbi:MAG: hypothetical protein CFH27_01058 [Alphaproteobacteria bacterium MarineAlpha6_Bin5]|nr:MAG: hypothetical protein CFH27_01058 [Alphaproteobacteria bacterium MarineAlpha6_Bin5]|tara:strand:- start:3351 stop:4448 length:1098 start_codon:yes stop_codon:yes gene_type:complete